jgi:uncharacterized protein (TIGR03118 family)
MTTPIFITRYLGRLAALTFGLALSTELIADPGNYRVTNLVADLPGVAANTDPNLVNAWGIVSGPTTPMWVSDNGSGKSTVYDGTGALKLTVTIPSASAGTGVPTGIAFNPGASPTSADFLVGGAGTAARFLWATEDGGIAAWAGGASATIKFAATDGAVYKGLAVAGDGISHFQIYAADFHNGKIDVIDSTFKLTSVPGGFADEMLPKGYAPFNIMNIQGNLYVAYALRQQGSNDEAAGPGRGVVNVFDSNGFLIDRVASHGKLNAPWGMALAPAGFGKFGNHLLVGNFGDGTINAYELENYDFAGQLRTAKGQVLTIDGLWGIAFGNGFQQQPANTLFFAAGPGDEGHGLYGKIEAVPAQHGHD